MSILTAVDAKKKPLVINFYPGNLPDASNISDFIDEFTVKVGLEIFDKGIPLEKESEHLGVPPSLKDQETDREICYKPTISTAIKLNFQLDTYAKQDGRSN